MRDTIVGELVRTAVTDPSVHYRDIVNSLPTAMMVLDGNLIVQYANLAYYQLFGGSEDDTLGQPIFDLQSGIWNDAEIRWLLEAVLPHDVAIKGYLIEQTFPVIGARILNLTAHRVVRNGAGTDQVLIGVEDVTNAEKASRAAEETIQKINAMMTEVHHRVKNNIASILSMLRIEARALDDEIAKDVLDRVALRVESMGSLYELLAVSENSGLVPLLPYFERVCRSIEQVGGANQFGWTIDVKGDAVLVSVDEAISIGAVVNELVANAAKYAFNGRQDIGSIRVLCVDRGNEIHITVADNGSGFDKTQVDPKSTGLGMRLVDMYLESLGGTIDRDSGPQGTTCFLKIPHVDEQNEVASSGTFNAEESMLKAKPKAIGPAHVKPTLTTARNEGRSSSIAGITAKPESS
ncbi:ATP-binding protein [Acuticoccus sp. M5D2P5]|uniref:sensor histidine kinase n=1 Tax=Acuticoccus kalidii TaxID=2910977 RepID=UPI001F470CE8|nr:histidine kinase dimerization/phosphoacceptor domain -containing protein [Acuticoccus kalidii]MCF3936633.1 ATP-binding protein [Acuticoccus kalidii]